jgi:hypothetical protein
MDSVSAYLAEKIELALTFYESRLARIDKNYLAGIDRLANRTRDRVLADFFRQTMNPGRISSALSHIRFCLSQGQIVEADKALERLKSSIDTVEGYLRRPVLNAGLGTSRGGAIGALAKHGETRNVLATDCSASAFDIPFFTKFSKDSRISVRLAARSFGSP